MSRRQAIFLDRDGTIIHDVHHLCDPGHVRLIGGAGRAIRRMRDAGYVTVIVTNQSVIGRGMLDARGLELVHAEMNRQLEAEGAQVDAIYFCPIAPTVEGERSAIEHPDRKPGPGMLLRAARELDLDLGRSWMIGDMVSDMLAGRNAGCMGTILLTSGHGRSQDQTHAAIDHVADDLMGAAKIVLAAGKRVRGSVAT
jgi:D-glycero-D-manno-heptose 1,7-bisphosphate phosphatase